MELDLEFTFDLALVVRFGTRRRRPLVGVGTPFFGEGQARRLFDAAGIVDRLAVVQHRLDGHLQVALHVTLPDNTVETR